jgi:hypothetical protein
MCCHPLLGSPASQTPLADGDSLFHFNYNLVRSRGVIGDRMSEGKTVSELIGSMLVMLPETYDVPCRACRAIAPRHQGRSSSCRVMHVRACESRHMTPCTWQRVACVHVYKRVRTWTHQHKILQHIHVDARVRGHAGSSDSAAAAGGDRGEILG